MRATFLETMRDIFLQRRPPLEEPRELFLEPDPEDMDLGEDSEIPTSEVMPQITTLQNGVRVITRHIPYTDDVDILLWVEAGSKDEFGGNFPAGTAHFFEHLPSTILGEVAEMFHPDSDAFVGATTGFSRTTFDVAGISADMLPAALSLISDIFSHPNLDELLIENERGIIDAEWTIARRNLSQRNYDEMMRIAYQNAAAMHPGIGTKEAILSMSKSDLMRFHRENYTADRVVIAIEGAVDHERIIAQLNKEFDLPPSTRERSTELPPYTGGMALIPDSQGGTEIALGFNCRGLNEFDNSILFMLIATILSEDRYSLIHQKARIERGLIYSHRVTKNEDKDMLIVTYTVADQNKVEKSLEAVAEALHELQRGISEDVLNRYKKKTIDGLRYFVERDKMVVGYMAEALSKYGTVMPKIAGSHRLEAITPEMISAAVTDMLSRPPTFVASGEVEQLPSYETICNIFLSPRAHEGPFFVKSRRKFIPYVGPTVPKFSPIGAILEKSGPPRS